MNEQTGNAIHLNISALKVALIGTAMSANGEEQACRIIFCTRF